MSGFSLWKNGKKTKDYNFQDRIVKEFIYRSGTGLILHKYIGPHKQDPKDSTLMLPQNENEINELTIQDVLLGENRDRKYSEDLIELRGLYSVTDNDFDLSQFGYMLSGDTIVLEFHTNDIIEKVGRKLMTGDVLELVHLRDDTSLDSEAGEIKKFYVVQDSNRSSTGYGPTWFTHVWRTRCTPIVDSQEYRSILHNQNVSLENEDLNWLTNFETTGESDAGVKDLSRDYDSNVHTVLDKELKQIEVIKEYQRNEVEKRSFYTNHLWIKSVYLQEKTGLISWMLNGDDIPHDFEGEVIFSGSEFPENPEEGDYFIRNDYVPERLFKRVGTTWRKVNDVWRRDWVPAHRLLESFINNDEVTVIGDHEDQVFDERQPLSEVVLPKSKPKVKK